MNTLVLEPMATRLRFDTDKMHGWFNWRMAAKLACLWPISQDSHALLHPKPPNTPSEEEEPDCTRG